MNSMILLESRKIFIISHAFCGSVIEKGGNVTVQGNYEIGKTVGI
jgi:hypothetical protein